MDMDSMMKYLEGAVVLLISTGFFWALMRYVPPALVKWLHATYEAAKTSPWWRAKPHRVELLVAAIRFLAEEVPDPGTGKETYAALGAKIAAIPAKALVSAPVILKGPLAVLVVLMAGSASKWAAALEKAGDAIDTELKDDLKDLLSTPPAPSDTQNPPAA